MIDEANWRRWVGALLALYLVLYLLPMDQRGLMRREEVRYAQIAREMVETGDWVVPRLNGLRYFEKPVLGTWLNAGAIALLGDRPAAARLAGVLCTGLTALYLFWFLRRHARNAFAGCLAAGIFLTSAGVFGIGSQAVLDTPLLLFLTLGLGSFYEAVTSTGRARLAWLVIAGLACGLAALTKGFLAFAVIAAVAAPFLAWEGRWRDLLIMPWLPALAAALVMLPWALAIHAREPDFWHYFFWVEHVQRFLGDDAQHSRPPWYFLVYFPLLALPWFLLVPAALRGLQMAAPDRALMRYLLSWFLLPFAFFSMSRGKLLTYILPCFPPFSMLLALGLRSRLRTLDEGWLRAGAWVAAGLFALALAWFLSTRLLGSGDGLYRADEGLRWLTLVVVLAFAVLSFIAAAMKRPGAQFVACFSAALLPFYFALAMTWTMPADLREDRLPEPLLAPVRAVTPADAIIVSDGRYFRSVCWVFDRSDLLMADEGELAYGLSYADARGRLLGREGLQALLDEPLRKRPLLVIIGAGTARDLRLRWPDEGRLESIGDMRVWRSWD